MADGKNFQTWLSGELLTHANRRVHDDFRGEPSKYLKSLIEQDAAGVPSASDEELLVSLAKKYHKRIVPRLSEVLSARGDFDQALLLSRFLDCIAEALADPQFDPKRPFNIVDAKKLAEWENVSEERLKKIAADVFELKMQSEWERAAEGRADYGKKKSRAKKPRQPTSPPLGQIKLQPHETDQPA